MNRRTFLNGLAGTVAWSAMARDSFGAGSVNSMREIPKPLYSDDELLSFVRTTSTNLAPMTFNVGICQDGTMATASLEQLDRLKRNLS
jgi:hypothetical protein